MGQLGVCALGDVHMVQVIVPIGGDIQTAQDIHKSGLAGAGLSDNGHKFPPVDVQRNPVQGANLTLLALIVNFVEIFYVDQHGVNPNCCRCL